MTVSWVTLAIWLKYKLFHVCPGYSFINAIWWIICVSLSKLFRELESSACLYPIQNTSIPHHKHNYHWLFIIESSHVFLLSLWRLFNFEKLILKEKNILKTMNSKSWNVLWANLTHFLIFTDEEYNFRVWKLNTVSSMNGLTNG